MALHDSVAANPHTAGLPSYAYTTSSFLLSLYLDW